MMPRRKRPSFIEDLARVMAQAVADFCDDIGRRRESGELSKDEPITGVVTVKYPPDELAARRRRRMKR